MVDEISGLVYGVEKCEVMHFGLNNTRALYLINDTATPTYTVELYLGVIIQDNVKFKISI